MKVQFSLNKASSRLATEEVKQDYYGGFQDKKLTASPKSIKSHDRSLFKSEKSVNKQGSAKISNETKQRIKSTQNHHQSQKLHLKSEDRQPKTKQLAPSTSTTMHRPTMSQTIKQDFKTLNSQHLTTLKSTRSNNFSENYDDSTISKVKRTKNLSATFIIRDKEIPDRNIQIKPDLGRQFIEAMPKRRTLSKLSNELTLSLRKAANESKITFEGNQQVYTGLNQDQRQLRNQEQNFFDGLRRGFKENREKMIKGLKRKLVINKRNGKKQTMDQVSRTIAEKIVAKTNKKTGSKDISDSELDVDRDSDEKNDNKKAFAPVQPSFYEEDLKNYLKKFDSSLQQRKEFKRRMADKMSFENTERNTNVKSSGQLLQQSSRQNNLKSTFKQPLNKATIATDQQGKDSEDKIFTINPAKQMNQTYLKKPFSDKRSHRPTSRGSSRAHNVLDYDWYGNSSDIDHLTQRRPDTSAERLRFEIGLRRYPAQTNFKAQKPWVFNDANQSSLQEMAQITQEQLQKEGYTQNPLYSTVSRIDPARDCRDRLPDHLSLPSYSDKFIAKNNPSLIRSLSKGGGIQRQPVGLNEMKWQVALRSQSQQKERAYSKAKVKSIDYQ